MNEFADIEGGARPLALGQTAEFSGLKVTVTRTKDAGPVYGTFVYLSLSAMTDGASVSPDDFSLELNTGEWVSADKLTTGAGLQDEGIRLGTGRTSEILVRIPRTRVNLHECRLVYSPGNSGKIIRWQLQ
ncbi:hypothetical protein GCM10027589_22210 [Actinocorallia lasiicapitis]